MRSLFDELSGFDRTTFRNKITALARRGVWIGTSSWRYAGWLDQIYSRDLYRTKGRFSKKRFETECLSEYAETFSTVCGDFAFYQFPALAFWRSLFARVPQHFQFSLKAPGEITRWEFADIARYRGRAGERNPSFLDAELFRSEFLDPLAAFRSQLGVIIFEVGALPRQRAEHAAWLLDSFDRFFRSIPREFRYAVEVRNPELLTPQYFECLRANGVAHVYNAWTKMPDLPAQLAIPHSITADFTVCRALLRSGRSYEQAVQRFSPYDELREPYLPAREGLRRLLGLSTDQQVYIYVNNRLEGNAPLTIESVIL